MHLFLSTLTFCVLAAALVAAALGLAHIKQMTGAERGAGALFVLTLLAFAGGLTALTLMTA
ncbi:hypothetical protein [Tropicibacter naphthalenivorans]|uniref:Uncharacterized protein n=1 Tax=Tropicibacter naphthalenivorans TaxID=441103 RepID=A0A0P1G5R6_9RHOB|nr:hypothetical protein [Tropicibacter naphthalenivorans]CUH77117.1 hypothetical protein TRN7648_01305 [Tropicibacter naphthalenivorans]SMC60595.1 hypothetical protein SAMN04488093_102313 [Tropicibacter naphthalenivorans]